MLLGRGAPVIELDDNDAPESRPQSNAEELVSVRRVLADRYSTATSPPPFPKSRFRGPEVPLSQPASSVIELDSDEPSSPSADRRAPQSIEARSSNFSPQKETINAPVERHKGKQETVVFYLDNDVEIATSSSSRSSSTHTMRPEKSFDEEESTVDLPSSFLKSSRARGIWDVSPEREEKSTERSEKKRPREEDESEAETEELDTAIAKSKEKGRTHKKQKTADKVPSSDICQRALLHPLGEVSPPKKKSKKVEKAGDGSTQKRKKKKTAEEMLSEMVVVCDERLPSSIRETLQSTLSALHCSVVTKRLIASGGLEWRRRTNDIPKSDLDLRLCASSGFFLLPMNADDFCERLVHKSFPGLFSQISEYFGGHVRILIAVVDMAAYFRFSTSLHRREQQDRIATMQTLQMEGGGPVTRGRVSKAHYQSALVDLHVDHHVQVLECASLTDLAQMVAGWTKLIAELPYKKPTSNAFGGFCAEASVRKSARTPLSAWKAQLTAISGLSEAVADAIIRAYPTLSSLVSRYSNNSLTSEQKKRLLEDLPVERALSERARRIGPTLSERVYRIFTELDGSVVV